MTIPDRNENEETVNINNIQFDASNLLNDNNDSNNKKRKSIIIPISTKNNSISNSNVNNNNKLIDNNLPPDGGFRAFSIVAGSFLVNGILFGVINSCGMIFSELKTQLEMAGETDVSSKASLVGSLTIGTTFFLSMIAGILTDKVGIQMTTFLGGAIASAGMLCSSFYTDKVKILYLTYGVMYGLGASLAYTPSLAILGHYFKRYLGLVNGIVTCGSSAFTILMPFVISSLLNSYGLQITLRFIAALTTIVMACAVLFKPIPHNNLQEKNTKLSKNKFRSELKSVLNLSIWKKKRYVVWACSIPLALFGYFVPYVFIGNFIEITFPGEKKEVPLMCIGITSGLGRLIFGFIADFPRVDRIFLQQMSFVSIGILTMCLSTAESYATVICISLGMGLFDGCFISLLGPIAFDICGAEGAAQAIGFLLAMSSVPLTVGPPIAGLIKDHYNSYQLPFLLAGIPPIVGAMAMFLIRCVKDDSENKREDHEQGMIQEPLTDPKWQSEKINQTKGIQDNVTLSTKNNEQKST